MRTLIENATVVTMNDRDDVLRPGWVEVRDGVIAAVSAMPPPADGVDRLTGP